MLLVEVAEAAAAAKPLFTLGFTLLILLPLLAAKLSSRVMRCEQSPQLKSSRKAVLLPHIVYVTTLTVVKCVCVCVEGGGMQCACV